MMRDKKAGKKAKGRTMRAKGATYAEISEALAVSTDTAHRWSREGEWIKGVKTKKAVQIAKAKAMRAKGATYEEIAGWWAFQQWRFLNGQNVGNGLKVATTQKRVKKQKGGQ